MSVQSQIDRITENVANTYDVLEGYGADMPQAKNTNNLSATAESIKAVLYGKEQILSDDEKSQVRTNIGAQPAGNYALKSEIPSVPVQSVNGKTGAVSLSASDVGALPNTTKIPSTLSDLSTDSTHRTVTDAEKTAWNAKAETSAIPTKISQLTNDSKFLTSFTETDPTVPSWAKASTKPTYTKSEVGLGNVDNTSDANKPVSTAQATAIADAKKAGTDAQSNLTTHTNNKSNPHGVTKAQVGLGNVENVKQYSANNPPVAIQSTTPSDTSVIWVDPTDNSGDEISNDERLKWESFITSELAKHGQLAPEFAESLEWLTENGDQSKLYVLPDGFIYAYMMTEKEATTEGYTNALDGTTLHINERWSHSGKKYSTGANGYFATEKLPVSAEQVVYTNMPLTAFNGNYPRIHYFDSSGGYVSTKDSAPGRAYRITTNGNGEMSWVVGYENATAGDDSTNAKLANADTITHMLVVFNMSQYSHGAEGTATTEAECKEVIISIGKPIVEGGTEIITESAWTSTGHAFVPADYEGRIVDLEKDVLSLKKGVANVTPIKGWDAPIYDANIPVFQISAEKAAMTNATNTPANIYAMYDALMARHPKYITKTDLGLCSDGVNHVYRYDFREPEPHHENNVIWSETKAKAIITTGIHYEWAGIYAMYYALEEIADNPELRNFRRNTHLIVVPVSNPYATIASNYSASMGVKNANGVEIHRNFEVDFKYPTDSGYIAEGELHHGGTVPLSEVETKYIDNIMKNNTDAAVFLSCHNYDGTTIWGTGFIWSSTATKYMCNLGFRLVDKLSDAWMDKFGDVLSTGIEEYKTDLLEDGDTRLGWAGLSNSPGTEAKQATKYGIQGTNVEISHKFLIHGTTANPEPTMSSFTMSRGAEVYVNFLLTAFGVYDPKDKKEYVPNLPWSE